jgi:hypothetical protein
MKTVVIGAVVSKDRHLGSRKFADPDTARP